jgi:hypothetical protein
MPVNESKPQSAGSMVLAVVIALASTAALVVFAATQSPARTASLPRKSRAAVNAAEEWAIWAPPATPSTAQAAQAAATITGCLEKHGDGFRLNDTSGADAPKSRSWKFGFLKKGSADVDLVNAGTATAKHVGTRVRVTGTLDDHLMRVRSINRVADSCS